MPLFDHFHPPLHGPRRWEGFHHAWATVIAQHLNQELPPNYFAEPEISLGLDGYEVRVYQDLGGAELRAAVELVSPSNKDRPVSRQTFAVKCANYLKQGVSVVIVDIVTARDANLHAEILDLLQIKTRRRTWSSPSGLYAVAYRAVPMRGSPRVEIWPEALALGEMLPVLPLWLSLDLSLPLRLEESYLATCQSLRISA